MSESEKLQRLRERVESQEAKLKKVRAMRGQVDYSKLINGNLCMYSRVNRFQNALEIAHFINEFNYRLEYDNGILG